MRSGNPVLGNNTFLDVGSGRVVTGSSQAMSLNGTVGKTGFLLALLVAAAAFTWDKASGVLGPGAALPWLMTGAIGGLVVALITVFKKEWSPVTAPAYALLEGLFIGLRTSQAIVGQRERLLGLGRLTAGLTHELNNPAAAAVRATASLRERVAMMRHKLAGLADGRLNADDLIRLAALQEEAVELLAKAPKRTPMEASDAEDEVGDVGGAAHHAGADHGLVDADALRRRLGRRVHRDQARAGGQRPVQGDAQVGGVGPVRG